jgi:hypothetical protein
MLTTACALLAPAAATGDGQTEGMPIQGAASGQQDHAVAMDCQQLADLLQQQRNLISRETGQIKRELVALRDDLGKPGFREIFAGFGYLFGMAGLGLYVHCRKSRRD